MVAIKAGLRSVRQTALFFSWLAFVACGGQTPSNSTKQAEKTSFRQNRARVMLKDSQPMHPLASSGFANLQYYGGHVIPSAKPYSVNWTSDVSQAIQDGMPQFYAAITDSPYFDWLSEYDTDVNAVNGKPGTNQHIGRGTFGGSITITPSITSKDLDDSQIQSELVAQIVSGALPAADENTIFMVNFPLGTTISLGGSGSCQVFCAYHGTINNNGQNIYYAVLPSFEKGSGCETGCGDDSDMFNNATSVASHELVEAVTDAEVGLATDFAPPLAWYDTNGGEIGDICNAEQDSVTVDGGTWVVQKQYSNKAGICTATGH